VAFWFLLGYCEFRFPVGNSRTTLKQSIHPITSLPAHASKQPERNTAKALKKASNLD
jgi:hypothetical protein